MSLCVCFLYRCYVLSSITVSSALRLLSKKAQQAQALLPPQLPLV